MNATIKKRLEQLEKNAEALKLLQEKHRPFAVLTCPELFVGLYNIEYWPSGIYAAPGMNAPPERLKGLTWEQMLIWGKNHPWVTCSVNMFACAEWGCAFYSSSDLYTQEQKEHTKRAFLEAHPAFKDVPAEEFDVLLAKLAEWPEQFPITFQSAECGRSIVESVKDVPKEWGAELTENEALAVLLGGG